MGYLSKLFPKVNYKEVIALFDGLEELFSGLIEGIDMKPPYEAVVTSVLAWIEEHADEWDRAIEQNQKAEAYIAQAKAIYYVIQNSIVQGGDEKTQDRIDDLEPLTLWFNRIERPTGIALLMYYHQRMRQLRELVELYRIRASRKVKTSRHLFEMGLKRIYGISEENYLEQVYETSGISFYRHGIYALASIIDPKIDWISDMAKADAAKDVLNRHLKFAGLAYRDYKIAKKGVATERLKPYQMSFGKYGGEKIKGRFQLQGNMNGFVGYRESDKEIFVGFSGTEFFSWKNWKTNFCQYFGKLDPVYVQAVGLLNAVWMGKTHKSGFDNSKITVCGHSLGGGLMQFAVGVMEKDDIRGYGYNSAGLSEENLWITNVYRPADVQHLHLPYDVVFVLPFTYQLGKSVKCNDVAWNPIWAHLLKSMRKRTGRYRHEYAVIEGE